MLWSARQLRKRVPAVARTLGIVGQPQTHDQRTSAIALVKEAREGKDEAVRELLRRVRPATFTEFQEMIFPSGGMSQIMFNWLCDEYDKWRGISLSEAC
jgi:hypothetical protein